MPPSDDKAWSFNQPVLLKKSRRTSSVLVWTLAGGTLFAIAWAFLAPLPQTVAVQGKLQSSSGSQSIDAPVPGVIEDVAGVEGQRVNRGDLLLRFDARDAQARQVKRAADHGPAPACADRGRGAKRTCADPCGAGPQPLHRRRSIAGTPL